MKQIKKICLSILLALVLCSMITPNVLAKIISNEIVTDEMVEGETSEYVIDYILDDGDDNESIETMECEYGTSYTLPSEEYEHDTLTFVNWNSKANNKGTTYKHGQTVKNLSSTNNAKITLYAQYSVESTPTPKVKTTRYDTATVTIVGVSGADGYDIFRSTSKNGTYTNIGTQGYAGDYTDSTLKENKTYYYKVKAYVLNSSNVKVYAPESEIVSVKTSSKPKFSVSYYVPEGYRYLVTIAIKNTGKDTMAITNLFNVYPYKGAIHSTAFANGYKKLEQIIIAPGKTKSLTLSLEERRYFGSGGNVAALFKYGTDNYFFSAYSDGEVVYI